MTIKECSCKSYSYLTYDDYCLCAEEIFNDTKSLSSVQKSKFKELLEFFGKMKKAFAENLKQMKLGFKELLVALKDKRFYDTLLILKFEFTKILQALAAAHLLFQKGLFKVLSTLIKDKTLDKIKTKVIKVDEILNKHPILKTISKVALAGILIFMWTRMTFIGNVNFDFDLSIAFDALAGAYTIKDLLGSLDGLQFLTLFFTGQYAGISFNWVLSTPILIVIMILYTTTKDTALKYKIKQWIKDKSTKIQSFQLHIIKR